MELLVNSFKLEPWVVEAVDKYIKTHHMKKSDFFREAIMAHLEDVYDMESFERTKNDKLYSLAEIKHELNLGD